MIEQVQSASRPDKWARVLGLAALSAVSLLGGSILATSGTAYAFVAAGGGFAVMAAGLAAFIFLTGHQSSLRTKMLAELVEEDPAFCFVTDAACQLQFLNETARDRFGIARGEHLAVVLRDIFASSEGMVFRLQNKALLQGKAQEHVAGHAEGFHVAVQRVADNLLRWRLLADVAGKTGAQHKPVAQLTLGRNGAILYMNEAARDLIGRRAMRIEEVFADVPLRNGSRVRLLEVPDSPLVETHLTETGAGRVEVHLMPVDDHAQETPGSIDSLPVPLLKLSRDGTILHANPVAREMLDLPVGAPGRIGDHLEGLGRDLTDWLRQAADARGQPRSEFLRLIRSERELYVQVTLSRVIEAGEPALFAVLNDATELKTLEGQFVQSQKMQAIGQLAGGVAHDFNNLLTAISGHCDLMLLRHDQGDVDYGDLVQINQNANRAAALVGQLLAFSRKQTLRPETLDLRDTISDLTHLLNRLVGEKVRLVLRHDPVLPPVRGDRRQLEQVIMNLVVNARDAMPEGGEIVIETEQRNLRDPLERDRAMVPAGTYVVVTVSDEGTGIAPDKLRKVFEPFFTTKRTGEGTGLGLSTVYGIVKQTGGFIFVDSVVGQGTCFTLMFPTHEEVRKEPEVVPKPKEQPSTEQSSGVILLVEDEAPVRAFAARALRLRGYTVLEAETAEDALNTLCDKDLVVDVFVTDVVMPGIDGPTWVKQAREMRPDVKVVFVSGYAEDVFGDSPTEIPNSVFLPKPFSLAELTETVRRQFV